ncbi:hypothetical protein J4436_03945 [Candidatus Woesearchaeota archaeon]|nr:hypothetical protein [Candidatus Woesearchaeota archaeon]
MQSLNNTVYSKTFLEILRDEDQINDIEEAMMIGYIDDYREDEENLFFFEGL